MEGIHCTCIHFWRFSFVQAQTSKEVKKKDDKVVKVSKKEKGDKVKANKDAQTPAKSTGIKKDGTPDMRLKVNKNKVQPLPQSQPQPLPQTESREQTPSIQPQAKQTRPQASTSSNTKVADKVLETDAKGRTIYQGPKGGK